jgi:Protein of unknown function (DUF3558)
MILCRLTLALAVVGLTAGCGGTVAGTPSAEGAAPSAAAAGAPTGDAATVDACSLLKPEEVQALIGANDGGKGTTSGRSVCTWTNPAELSVTVDIGNPDTAINGLPAWDPALGPERPLGDGMRSLGGGGSVEFVAGNRDCEVQVVTDPTSKDDDAKAVALAKVVQGRI